MSDSNEFVETERNCTEKGNCTFIYLPQTLNFTGNNTSYFQCSEEMFPLWAVYHYFSWIVITYALTFFVGVLGNVLVIVFLVGEKNNRNNTSVFLVSLAIADLLLLFVCAPLDLAQYFSVRWDDDGAVCKLAAFAESVSAFAAVLNLLAVTWERFVVIVYPFRSRSLCTLSNSKRILACVWITSFVLALPVVFSKGIMKYTLTNFIEYVTFFVCKDSEDWWGFTVAVYRFSMLFLVPAFLMIATYAWVIVKLWYSTRTMEGLTNGESICEDSINHDNGDRVSHHGSVRATRQQVIKMLVLVVVLFLLCWGPRLVIEIIIKCCLDIFDHSSFKTRFIIYLLPFLHCSLNPFIYCFMSSKFREKLSRTRKSYMGGP